MTASVTETQGENISQQEDEFVPTRNYTDPTEQQSWWYVKRWSQDNKSVWWFPKEFWIKKQDFRSRRIYSGEKKTLRMRFGSSDDIGAFIKLTNSYCLVGGEEQIQNLHRVVQTDLTEEVPVINTSLAGCQIIGRMCLGNKHGLIVPDAIYDTEMNFLKETLPESVKINKVDEKLSALGNVGVCNDKVALIHPDLDKESEEIIADTLQVEVFRHMIANNPLVGSNCVLNNYGGLVHVDASNHDLEDLTSLLQLPLVPGTVNRGNKVVASALIANDFISYAGMKTTAKEISNIETAFQMSKACWF